MEKETTSSQSEWLTMEVFWAGDTSLTAKEVIKKYGTGQICHLIWIRKHKEMEYQNNSVKAHGTVNCKPCVFF